MKYSIAAFFFLVLFSNFGCSNQEEVTETTEKTEVEMKEAAEGWVTGTITSAYAEEGCGFLIQLDVTDASLGLLNPAVLEEAYQKDGMRVKLKFQRTRMPQPNECNKGILVILNEIKKI